MHPKTNKSPNYEISDSHIPNRDQWLARMILVLTHTTQQYIITHLYIILNPKKIQMKNHVVATIDPNISTRQSPEIGEKKSA